MDLEREKEGRGHKQNAPVSMKKLSTSKGSSSRCLASGNRKAVKDWLQTSGALSVCIMTRDMVWPSHLCLTTLNMSRSKGSSGHKMNLTCIEWVKSD